MASQDHATTTGDAAVKPPRQMTIDEERELLSKILDDRDLLSELLGDLWFCHCEQHAIGGGPGWREREQAAWARVAEYYQP